MKINPSISLMKLTIRLLILMILFVILFLISAVLYSSRYWPDVYKYINANITIKRIPTLSELNITILEVDFTTEYYSTVDDYVESSTVEGIDFNIDDFTNFNDDNDETKIKKPNRAKRYALEDFGKDYSELPKKNVVVDYLFIEDPTTVHEEIIVTKIVRDLIDDSKLVPKNYGDVEIMTSLNEVDAQKITADNTTDVTTVFPWISTIFIKNDTKSNQFEYYCDGALLSERLLITAARCVALGNSTVDPENVLVILGKKSLQSMADKEQTVKIMQIITHENFTNENGKIENDLAMLVFENSAIFNDLIQAAVIGNDTEEVDKSFTTAWNLKGDLVPVALQDNEVQACKSESAGEHKFCASYGLNVALCPSYGGIFAGYQSDWRLYGIRSGDTTNRGLCLHKDVWFTDLRAYEDWILEHME